MEKLIKRFEGIIDENYGETTNKPFNDTVSKCAEECRKIAIEFAKRTLESEIETDTKDEIQSNMNIAYKMLIVLLEKDGIRGFNTFINEYYE
jgi:hypothetical protein